MDWEATYAPFLGRALTGISLQSLASDGPSIAEAAPSGHADVVDLCLLGFDGDRRLHLTWMQQGPYIDAVKAHSELGLWATEEWRYEPLNRSNWLVDWVAPWDRVLGGELLEVSCFGFKHDDNGTSYTARHRFGAEGHLWISLGQDNVVGGREDLIVSLTAPSNLNDLQELRMIH